MQITDPIADLLTRIRNASAAKHQYGFHMRLNQAKNIVIHIFFSDSVPSFKKGGIRRTGDIRARHSV